MRTFAVCLLATATAVAHPPRDARPQCTCVAARRSDGWCAACRVGYVAFKRVESKALFDAVDFHGHHIDPQQLRCSACRKAIKEDGFCDACRMGFKAGQAYFSRLTYHLARGQVAAPSKIDCAVCRGNTQRHGWCDVCRVGLVGNRMYRDKNEYLPSAKQMTILDKAIQRAPQCETCAIVMLVDARCPVCKISYRNGATVEAPVRKPSRETRQD